jgi:hypothetical protein
MSINSFFNTVSVIFYRWKKTPFSIAKQRGKENIFRKILEYCPVRIRFSHPLDKAVH